MLWIRQLILKALAVSALLCIDAATPPSLLAQNSASQVQVTVPVSPVSVSGALGTRSPFLGSVPTGTPTATVLPLSLSDALDRGLKHNLGLIESDVRTRAARAERLRNLSELLPNISASVSQFAEQVNLRALGVKIPLPGFPVIVGPFGVEDARAYWSQKLFDWNAVENLRASQNSLKASGYSYKDSRDLVVLAVANAYLQVISDRATIESQQAQLDTSRALYQRAQDQTKAGVAARIDELRADVELKTQQQRLISAQDQLAKDALTLARTIGLPPGQEFSVTDSVPYAPLQGVTLEKGLQDAYANRSDYLSAQLELRAADLSRKAAVAENYPSVTSEVNYGDIGPNFANSHGTFTAAASVNIPIFQGTRVRGDVVAADATLQQRRAEVEDLRGRIDQDVRSAFLDLTSAADLVNVAESNKELARETLTEAQDRFGAGVTDNIEVVQAQESVSSADQAYISSLYTFNIAKVQLARAMGVAEKAVKTYLGGQ
ncbi:MAG: TolC family protein [Acidobacteria bacterium]|nr:MAG: TolC family protein [Acidobacteriota bacterium]